VLADLLNERDHWAPLFECETCTRQSSSQNAVNQHVSALGHFSPKIPCETCGTKFHTAGAANEHMERKGHYKHYCKTCNIKFANENALRMVRRAIRLVFVCLTAFSRFLPSLC
jgi:transcription elongation factor Elf1